MYLCDIFKNNFKVDAEWFEFYVEVREEIPIDYPAPYGKDLEINYWVGLYHAGCCLTRRRHRVALVFIN